MEALLKIKAVTEGEGGVMALARGMGSLKEGAEKASTGLKGALSSVGGMSSALGALVPLASGAGLVTLAKHAIDLGDDMNDMSQKTGVSVEMLSKFKQAAESSGTSVEGVTNAMVKLNKNMGTGNKATSEALKDLGISATDANGKLKSTDEVMLEVADKFQKMPDGANKTTAAIALFGKAGADMIPMLNGGRDSIESMTATMSTSFAKGADKFNDKMAALQAKILELGVGIGTALLPVLTALTDGISAIADGFQSLPGPLQTLIGGVVALAAAFVVLAPAIGAIASLGGVVGPAIAAITVALGGLLTFATSTLIPGLLAVFSGPVGWTVLAVAAVVAMVVAFREPIGKFLGWLGEQFGEVGPALLEVFNAIFVDPWINLWNDVLRKPVTAIW
ncbi:MAG: phage tail tape measure protein, partial [Synechococcaceae cyanobacterium ELA739]